MFKIQRQDARNRLPVKSPRNLCELVAVKDAVELQGCAVACVHADNPTAHVGPAKDSSVSAYVDHGVDAVGRYVEERRPKALAHITGGGFFDLHLGAQVDLGAWPVPELFATVHYVPDEGVDDGPPVASAEVPIHPGDTLEVLRRRIHEVEHELIVSAQVLAAQPLVRIGAPS